MSDPSSAEPRRQSTLPLAHPATSPLPPRSSGSLQPLPETPVHDAYDSPMESSWTFLDKESPDLSLIPSPTPSALSFRSDDIPFEAFGYGELSSPPEVPMTPWLNPRTPATATFLQEPSTMSTEESDSYVDPQMIGALERKKEPDRNRISTLASSLGFGDEGGPLTSTPPRRSREDLKSTSFDIAGRALPAASPSTDPRPGFPTSSPPPDPTAFRTGGGLASGSRGSQAQTSARGSENSSTKARSNAHSTPWDQHYQHPTSFYPPNTPSLAIRRSPTEPIVLRPNLSPRGKGLDVEPLSPQFAPHSTYYPPPSSSSSPLTPHRQLPTLPPRSLSAGDLVALQHDRPVSPAREQAFDPPVVAMARLVSLTRSSRYAAVEQAGRPLPNLPTPPPSTTTSYRRSTSPQKPYDSSRSAYPIVPLPTPPASGSSKHHSLRGSYPFPSAPPAIPLPAPPSFTSVFIDPITNAVPPSPSLPRTPRSTLRPARTTHPSSAARLQVQIAEREEPEENADSLGRSSEQSMQQRFLDWSRRQAAPQTDADRPLNELLLCSAGVESKLDRGATASEGESERWTKSGQFRLRRTTSMASKWSFGILGSSRGNTPEGQWSKVGNEEGDRRTSKRMRREEREKEKERKRVIDSRRKTQDWLAGVSMGDVAGLKDVKKPWWSFRQGHRRRPSHKPFFSSRRVRILLIVGIGVVGAIVAIVLVLILRRRAGDSSIGTCVCENDGKAVVAGGECSCVCRGEWGGPFCQLDATCANPSGVRSQTIAQGLLDVAAHANTLFSPSIDPSRLSFVVNTYLGISTNSTKTTCEAQLDLISLPVLPPSTFPNRLAWTSAAVLWSAAMSESNATGLLGFANSRTFDALGDVATKPNSNFQKIAGGYIFDLAAMTVAVPPTTWITQASPSTRQTSLVGSVAENALNHVTGFALASSSQRTMALSHYWEELGLAASDLVLFKAAVAAAPVIVPWDATSDLGGEDVFSLPARQTANSSFPPAVGCLPGLTSRQVAAINSVEVTAFGLESVSSSAALDAVCLDRPIYGVLNLLNLRLPFADSDSRPIPKQGLVLAKDNKARMSLHAGELLVGEIAGISTTSSTPSLPDRFGTFERLDHVLLDYLSLLSTELAQELVAFVLGQPPIPVPPLPSSALYQASNGLASLPILEFALWGGLRYANVDYAVSGLTLPGDDSALFFGSSAGDQFRTWALEGPLGTASQSAIQWSLTASGAAALGDGTLVLATTSTLGRVWSAAGNGSMAGAEVWSELGGV